MMHLRTKRSKYHKTCIPGYKWCGPLCSGPGEPVNRVDKCCKLHDLCYMKHGYFSCFCNQKLLQCLKPLINRNKKEGITAEMIYRFYSKYPCINSFSEKE